MLYDEKSNKGLYNATNKCPQFGYVKRRKNFHQAWIYFQANMGIYKKPTWLHL